MTLVVQEEQGWLVGIGRRLSSLITTLLVWERGQFTVYWHSTGHAHQQLAREEREMASAVSVVSPTSYSCQCQHGPASQHCEVCAGRPQSSPWRWASPDCPSVCQSECVGCSVHTGRQRGWRGVWWHLWQPSSAAWHCVWCGCSRGVECGSVGASHCV